MKSKSRKVIQMTGLLLAAAMVTSMACDDDGPGPESSRSYTLALKYSTGAVLAGAKVLIPLEGRSYSATTDSHGKCSLKIPDTVQLPSWVIALIDHPSIMPESVGLPGGQGQQWSASHDVLPAPKTVYVRDAYLHHLGNDRYGGEANSQLQIRSEGLERSYIFLLGGYPSRMPMLRLFARGVQHPAQIKINGMVVATLGNSFATGELSNYDFRLGGAPTSVLHTGRNTLTIRTAPYNGDDPWDDIEFSGMALYFQ